MKRLLLVIVVAASTAPAFAGVSVEVGEPGFYGRIEIGNFPRPPLIYERPVVIERVPVTMVREPIYLHVPPGHAKNWRKHCHRYNACGQRVYFVRNDWYDTQYVPRYRERHGGGQGKHRDDDDRGERHDRGEGNDHRHGKGKGKGKGR